VNDASLGFEEGNINEVNRSQETVERELVSSLSNGPNQETTFADGDIRKVKSFLEGPGVLRMSGPPQKVRE
jgi:hypothetical protein